MVLVDSNVLLDVSTNDPRWFAWSSAQLEPIVNSGEAAINPIIYAELAPSFRSAAELDSSIVPPGDFHRLALPYAYRRAGGVKTSPLPDFFIGAHAEVESLPILTRDPSRYRNYFPTVRLICP